MSMATTVSILIVNHHAEEIKLATIGFRGFFAECRVEVAYSAEEARMLAAKQASEWTVILIDEGCLEGPHAALIEDLKRQAMYAGVILQSDRFDDAAVIDAMRAGADFFLSKASPAFLAELLFCAKAAVEKQELGRQASHARARHEQLVESLPDVYYELDSEGRFVAAGPNITALLGYSPQELIGSPYTVLLFPGQQSQAQHRFNERRSGPRGTHRVPVTLQRKAGLGEVGEAVPVEVSARGLYDPQRRFLGTVGTVRHTARIGSHPPESERQRQEVVSGGEWLQQHRRATLLAEELRQPLSALQAETTRLAEAVQAIHLVDRLDRMKQDLVQILTRYEQLDRELHAFPESTPRETLKDLLEQAVRSVGADPHGVETDFAPEIPFYGGNREEAVACFRLLLLSTRALAESAGRSSAFLIRSSLSGVTEIVDSPPLLPVPQPAHATIEYLELERGSGSRPLTEERAAPPDFFSLYQRVRNLGGTMTLALPTSGPLRLVVQLPLAPPDRHDRPEQPAVPAKTTGNQTAASSVVPAAGKASSTETERRASGRISTTLSARVTADATTWEGTITNLSVGGACLTLPPEFPGIHPQEAPVTLRTAIGVLELTGNVSLRGGEDIPGTRETSPVQLIVTFHPPEPIEASILASLVEAARDQSLPFSLETRLSLLAETAGTSLDRSDETDDDRRESVRVPLAVPVRLEQAEQPEQSRLVARAENISRQGACLLVKSQPDRLRGSVLLHFAAGKSTAHPGPHEPGVPDASLPAKIVWRTQDLAAPPEFRPQDAVPAARIGVRFLSLTPYAERELARLIRQHLAPTSAADRSAESSVLTIHRELRNARGQTIAVADDHLRHPLPPDTPVLIISPGYGQTARDYVEFSRYLAHHRLRILRYDHSNHIGMSDGELQNTTLRGMQTDLAKVVEFVQHTWPAARIVVLASDLAARAALKMAVHHPVDLLLLVNPVIDVGDLLLKVHGHDLVADYRYGLRRGISNLLGLNVNLDQFVGDIVAGRLTDLASTLEDIRLLRTPLAIISSPQHSSSPLPASDLPHAFMAALGTQTRMVSIPSALANQSLGAADVPAAFRQVLEQVGSMLSWPVPKVDIDVPTRRSIVVHQRLELEQTRLHRNVSQISRDAIALAHLQQLPQLANLHDYRKLLDDLYAFLAPLESGMAVVDAGIGQSDVTRAMLVNHAYRTRQRGVTSEPPPLLIGLGRSGDHVQQARHNVQLLQRELMIGKMGGVAALPPLTVTWMRAEWSQALPFQTGSVHRIVCNLSLSFVNSPRSTLMEWHRILHPEGRLVFTTFHPGTDLSQLYRRHLRLANQDEFSPAAQPVLHYLGRLREAIRHGILHTYSQPALTALLGQTGMTTFRISPTFDGQAFVVIVGKQISTSSLS
ncbi:MAG TPA: PilZ domain-containing protein [Nitrospira sp.]|nr:PilZ domain-containing protein [Nitrospira sp.]